VLVIFREQAQRRERPCGNGFRAPASHLRSGGDQSLPHFASGGLKDPVGHPFLNDPAPVHDDDPVGPFRDKLQVVADENKGDAVFLPECIEQAQNILAQGSVEGGYCFVGDQHGRVGGQGAGNGDPLALPAAECVRFPVSELSG